MAPTMIGKEASQGIGSGVLQLDGIRISKRVIRRFVLASPPALERFRDHCTNHYFIYVDNITASVFAHETPALSPCRCDVATNN